MHKLLRFRTAALLGFVAVAASIVTVIAGPAERADALSGSQFDPGYIISDANFYNGSAMTQAEIQSFLDSKVATCANSNCLEIKRTDTVTRPANSYCSEYVGAAGELTSAIIFKVQQACGVSAKVILVTLQKEQGLITATAPSDGKLERAMGYACPDTGSGCDPTYAGLYNQIYRAAWQFKRYGDPGFTRYPVGSPSAVAYHPNGACGSGTVTIRNKATAALYYYTPYQPNAAALSNLYGIGDGCSSYGNRNFWRYYSDWFGTPTGLPGSPDGDLDTIVASYNKISISGWAADPTVPADPVTLSVQVDAAWYALTADQPREGLAESYPTYGADHGFSGEFPVTAGSHTVCIYLKNIGAGGDISLGCRVVVTPNGSPMGELTSVVGAVGALNISGWVVDTDHPEQATTLAIQVGGQWFSYVADAAAPVAEQRFPGAGSQHGIAFSTPMAPGTYPVCVYAKNVGAGGEVSLGCTYATVSSVAPVGSLVSVTPVLGGVAISGWAVDADTPTTAVMLDVQVGASWYLWTANGQTTLSDAAVPGAGSAHGFSGTVTTPAGSQTVCVYPRNTGIGVASSLGCRTVTVAASPSLPPVGALQTVTVAPGQVSIAGWAVDADAPTTPLVIDVQLNGWKSLTADQTTTLAEAAVPGSGTAHGFSGSWSVPVGTYTMCVYVKGQGAGGDASLGCRTVVVPAATGSAPVGALQSVTVAPGQVSIAGWAVDADAPTTPVVIDLQLNGWKSLTANGTNAAADAAVPGSGANHGFTGSWSVPAGTYTMCVYMKGQGAGGDGSLGCRSVTVPAVAAKAPVGALQTVTVAPGQVSISGWAVDADAPTTPLVIDVQLDGWKSLTADQATTLAEAAVPGSGTAHGFSGSWSVPAGTHTMCVYVKGQGAGGDASLGCRYVTVPVGGVAPVGQLQTASGLGGRVSINGWAVDADAPTTPVVIDVQLDGWKSLTANLTNPLGASAVAGAGNSHGFAGSWVLPTGAHILCVYVKGQGAGGDASLGCQTVNVTSTAAKAPVGQLTSITGTGGKVSVAGWAVDPDAPSVPLVIDVQVAGWQALTANQTSAASETAVPGSGTSHGFSGAWTVPTGSQTVCIYAKGQGAGGDTSLGCRVVNVTP